MDILVRRALFFAILVTLSGLTVVAEELDQHGKAHAWTGPSDGYTIIDFAAAWCRPDHTTARCVAGSMPTSRSPGCCNSAT